MNVRERLASAPATLAASLLFAGGVLALLVRRHASAATLAYDVPIVVPIAALAFDRFWPTWSDSGKKRALDGVVIALGLLRVIAPPLPFASGHTMFTAYAALTARRWPLRASAAVVLVEVAAIKVFVTHDVLSLVLGLVGATGAAVLRRRLG